MNLIRQLSAIADLPTLPQIVLEVQLLVNSQDTDARNLSQVIEKDPPLAAKILRIANSALYGSAAKRMTSIPLAVARVGFNEVRNLAIAMSIIRQFPSQFRVLDYSRFWHHSLMAAHLAQLLSEKQGLNTRGEEFADFYTAGLLHDIGILIYDQFFHEAFEDTLSHAMRDSISYRAAEEQLRPGESHAFVGGALLELWRMDSTVVAAVRYHHAPSQASERDRRVACTLYLSEYILCNSSMGSFEGTMADDVENIRATVGIRPDSWPDLLSEAETAIDKCHVLLTEARDGLLPLI